MGQNIRWLVVVALLGACADPDAGQTPGEGASEWSTILGDGDSTGTSDVATDTAPGPDLGVPGVEDAGSLADAADPIEDASTDEDTVAPDVVTPTEDATPTEDVDTTEDIVEPPGPGEPDDGVELNQGWIGGACGDASDCWSSDFSAAPSCELSGFPNGYCTQPCDQSGSGSWVCPDTTYGASTGATMSRCITSATGAPLCSTECDFALSPTGCRPGYGCVMRQRHGEPNKIYPICLPMEPQGWPGESPKGFDIGDPCGLDQDCESLMCLQLPGGYCTKPYCEFTGCPAGSTCYAFEGGGTACLDDCSGSNECRESEGYTCDDYGSCWPAQGPVQTSWDPSVGPGDCASAWVAGLSPCDSIPDDFVVANKGARNLALCQGAEEVVSFHMGLGFAPAGDKQVEGDGKTPEGVFYVSELVPGSKYYKAFLISYPDPDDAAWGLSQGLISGSEKSAIDGAHASCQTPPQTTALGSYIELHGEGGGQDWTWGCMAVDNDELDQIWAVLGPQDTIVVKP